MSMFDWIREGVRRSVLLGVSDAVTQLGLPNHDEELNPQLAGVLREAPALNAQLPLNASAATSGGRKRLGKSLADIQGEAARKADA